ncbi:acyl carrier protein (plasmid) [Streptomyces globisporus]|uniref:acyl carrier protein n=1 Tax=Streptomyces globisporus TaxID=1908 RepID=UPI003865A0E8|nr:acyl carrier protein [Streptomyces globisporus]
MSLPLTDDDVRGVLRSHLAEVLYCEPAEIGDETNFEDLGLDSVLGAEVTAVINSRYGLSERVEAVYQNPTLTRLAAYVATQANAAA